MKNLTCYCLALGALVFVAIAQAKTAVQIDPASGRVVGMASDGEPTVPLTDAEIAGSVTVLGPKPAAVAPAVEASPAVPAPAAVDGQLALVHPSGPAPKAVAVPLARPRPTMAVDLPLGADVLRPGSDGSITVAPRRQGGDSLTLVPNPFDVRFVPAAVLDEYQFQTTGLLWGSSPVSFINDRSYGANDRCQGFRIHQVRTDGCVLERDSAFFFLPAGRKVTIRLPKQ